MNDQKTLHSAFIRFSGLPYELISLPTGMKRWRSNWKWIPVHPPEPKSKRLWSAAMSRNIQHHDRASLLAGKLHAILQRPYMKGRDLYDLIWYLSDRNWPAPNLTLLKHALAQTDCRGPDLTLENWHEVVSRRTEPYPLNEPPWSTALPCIR